MRTRARMNPSPQTGLGYLGIEPVYRKAYRGCEVPRVHGQLSDLPLRWRRRITL